MYFIFIYCLYVDVLDVFMYMYNAFTYMYSWMYYVFISMYFFLYMYLFVHRCIFSLHVFISSPAYLFVYLFIYVFMYIYIHTIFVREVDESARDVILKALPAGSFCKCAAKSAA